MKADPFEKYVKDQLQNQEVKPSRNLWSAIEEELPQKTKSNFSWLKIAVVVLLFFGILGVIFFAPTVQKNDDHLMVQHQEKLPENTNSATSVTETVNPPKARTQNQNTAIAHSSEKSEEKREIPNVQNHKNTDENYAKEIPENQNFIEFKEKKVEIHLPKIETSIAQNDTVKPKKKKKNYVDANALLFSVEHRDAIEKSKDGSNVATIELDH